MSALKQYINRSLDLVRRNTVKVIRMDLSADQPPLPMYSFDSAHPPVAKAAEFALGSDADIGGLSTAHLTAIPSDPSGSGSGSSSSTSHFAFHGNLSLEVPDAYAGRIRVGYAAFRNKTRPTLFGEDVWDLSLYTHIRVVVAYRGLETWRDKWMCNIQTDGPVRSDLFQHRLSIPAPSPSDSSSSITDPFTRPYPMFHTLHLPISAFILTNSGQTADKQIVMMRNRVRTIGFALLGGGRSGDDQAPPPQLSGDQRASLEMKKRMAAGGWGKGEGEVNVDRELEELLASDEPAPAPGALSAGEAKTAAPAPSRPAPISTRPAPVSAAGGGGESASGGAYHRLGGAAAPPPPELRTRQVALEENTPIAQQGYYELCVKSIEAVKWDPEAEEVA